MIARPCIGCGEVIPTGSYCTDCKPADTRTDREHVAWRNGARWKAFSKRLRRLAPFCEHCGTADDLTVDHLLPVHDYPELAYAAENCRVLCRPCNGKRGNKFSHTEAAAVLRRLESAYNRRPTKSGRERVNVAQRAVHQGIDPLTAAFRPVGKAQEAIHTGRGCA
ncbi:HNH endonuclease [Mycolicibacterium celeriflavum]|uniref:Uncharacterized protein n=1 Tax=Mycolicibacterium celeriflavum TaxID=1249101 RepID=A0A1X0BZ93_MYCCF|nr:HNH endonuclease [Mycolicibacterium celeriflavum]MCV7237710.1 HNH endonuclease [Mycolicibacterium celeriflavum]ORA49978.1 hypothetical protein BST21_05465 [Mycolicibacterium celeriflavum]BBY42184.1 hypothetical protein MCEL_04790 [Mycolicibacterium celeriflavum]